jgi:hypothetical protein
MGRKPKYQGRPTFHWQPANMIQDATDIESGKFIEIGSLRQYLMCLDMCDGQADEAFTKLLEAVTPAEQFETLMANRTREIHMNEKSVVLD